jgi:hypothetical protein
MTKKHWWIYVVSKDEICSTPIHFDAHNAVLINRFTLLVDGIYLTNNDGFRDLQEGWIN